MERTPEFFKLILKFNIEEKMLRLPLRFVRQHSDQLSNTNIAKLSVPDGRVWKVALERIGENIWLQHGFHEFARHYSLGYGHMLRFEYKGASNFTVSVYDLSCCEISYPPQNVIRIPDSPDPHPSASTVKIRKKNVPNKNQVNCKDTKSNGIPSPRQFKSERPHFQIKLTDTNFRHRIAYVPTKFSRKHMKGAKDRIRSIKFELGDGTWNVSLRRNKGGRFIFGGGWIRFCEDNSIKETDVCIFELVNENLFKVHLVVAL